MVSITFIEHDGTEHQVDAEVGQSVMRVALNHGVPGIMADCGGQCACATCHAYIEDGSFDRTGAPSEEEQDMLECAIEVQPNSRLTCQVAVTPALEGLVVRLPESQL